MKLEQRRMFEVDGFNEPVEVDAIYKDNKVFLRSIVGDNDFCQPLDTDVFFDTQEAANSYHSKIIAKINKKEVKKYIAEIGYYSDKLKEILPDYIYRCYERGRDSSMYLSRGDRNAIIQALNGILNIDAASFRLSDVSHVCYGENWLSVILKNGKKITPRTDTEVFIIESVFGDNNSGRYDKTINKPLSK